MIKNLVNEIFLRGIASYYGMTIKEFCNIIGDDKDKLYRFILDFANNHN